MFFNTDDTICAIASATGGAARGIVRVSGPGAPGIVARVFESEDSARILPAPFATAVSGRIKVEFDGSLRSATCDLFLWPTNRSYTRQPVAELHTVGSTPVLHSLADAVCKAGARLAEPGEFTLRAFLAGRIDLTQAEAVLGVIDSQGDEDFQAALAQLAGGLAQPLHRLREELLQLLAELEAGLDFGEEDIEFVSPVVLREQLSSAREGLDKVSEKMASRQLTREAIEIAIVGPPNVGKSSLFNALVERFGIHSVENCRPATKALTSPIRGTTRDYLTASISLKGVRCELIDTAGVDDVPTDASAIDSVAQSLTSVQRKRATIRAFCVEPNSHDFGVLRVECAHSIAASDLDIIVATKMDLLPNVVSPGDYQNGVPTVLTSSQTGQGLEEFGRAIRAMLMRESIVMRNNIVAATAERCRENIRRAADSLGGAERLLAANGGNELIALEIRAALDDLGHVVGTVYTDDLLDTIFGKFCIGK